MANHKTDPTMKHIEKALKKKNKESKQEDGTKVYEGFDGDLSTGRHSSGFDIGDTGETSTHDEWH